jgi:hypothetical protein
MPRLPSLDLFRAPTLLAVCAALLSVGAGCSFVFVDGPPANHRKLPYFNCTTSNTLPIVDLAVGGLLAASTVSSYQDGSSTSSGEMTAIAVAVGEAALFGASAIYGFNKTSSCREAHTELMARLPPSAPFAPAYAAPPQPAYDPWLHPSPGAFAAPPQSPPAPPPIPGPQPAPVPPPAPAPAAKPPAADSESPKPAPKP